MQLLSRDEVLRRTSLSRATLWRMEDRGKFPKAVRISANRIAYDSDKVDDWIKEVLSRGLCA